MSHPRDRPLEPLARALGYRPCRRDKARWTRPGSVISINGPKFYDHLRGCGGGGAIDFVIHATACTPRQAIAWLASTDHGPQRPRATPAKPLILPRRCPASWPAVRRWLMAAHKGIRRVRPDGATDWNDILQQHGIYGLIGGTPLDPCRP